MENLEVRIDEKLDQEISRLAVAHYGDDSEASRRQVIETALKMRILWSYWVQHGYLETEEAVSNWEFTESPVIPENGDEVRRWLFRR